MLSGKNPDHFVFATQIILLCLLPLKDNGHCLAIPACSDASVRALCGESPDSTLPDLPKTHRKFH